MRLCYAEFVRIMNTYFGQAGYEIWSERRLQISNKHQLLTGLQWLHHAAWSRCRNCELLTRDATRLKRASPRYTISNPAQPRRSLSGLIRPHSQLSWEYAERDPRDCG